MQMMKMNRFVCTGSFGDSLKAGAIAGGVAYASGHIFNGIGEQFNASSGFFAENGWGHIAAHGLAGGALAELQGGKFGHGFLSAGFTKAVTPHISAWDTNFDVGNIDGGQAVAAAIVGGTISEATGGKFANGAVTAAYANVFNQQASKNKQIKAVSSIVDEHGNTIYTLGEAKVMVLKGRTVKNMPDGNTIEDVLTASKKIGNKLIYVSSGYRENSTTEHKRVALDIYVHGSTEKDIPGYRDQINELNIFNRVNTYENKNIIHLDYKATGNQGRFHEWIHESKWTKEGNCGGYSTC